MATVDRITRVEEVIKRELAGIILNKLKDPRVGIVTITKVKVSRDLSFADISLTVMGDETTEQLTLDILRKAAGYIRKELASVIVIKKMPQPRFHIDQEYKKAMRVYDLLNELDIEDE